MWPELTNRERVLCVSSSSVLERPKIQKCRRLSGQFWSRDIILKRNYLNFCSIEIYCLHKFNQSDSLILSTWPKLANKMAKILIKFDISAARCNEQKKQNLSGAKFNQLDRWIWVTWPELTNQWRGFRVFAVVGAQRDETQNCCRLIG